jgi:thiol-disulfide isomerase/thioredoxin
MRSVLTATLLVGLALAGQAQEPKLTKLAPAVQEPKKPEPTLKVGDPAPPVKATKWLQGAEVKSFARDHVYVVEFWATWCGPCIVMMPHMSALQQEYKGKVTFIGHTRKDPRNSEEQVSTFVTKRGPLLKYTFAYADDSDTYDSYMKAAGRGGIPCCFVVDKDTRIAFIGHPMYLDVVLPKVVAGTWTKDDVAATEKIETEVNAVFKSFSGDAETALKTVAEFEKNHPKLAHIPYFIRPKIGTMLKAKKTAEALKYAQDIIAKASKADDFGALQSVSGALSTGAAGDKELSAVALQAAEASLKIAGEKDAASLYFVAEAHFAGGNKAKAREFGDKAIAAADDGGLKGQLEQLTKKYKD